MPAAPLVGRDTQPQLRGYHPHALPPISDAQRGPAGVPYIFFKDAREDLGIFCISERIQNIVAGFFGLPPTPITTKTGRRFDRE
jgi:hypothetical protein